MRILVAGGGAFGTQHLETLHAIGGLTLAVAEPHEVRREALREKFALADVDADVVALIGRFRPDGMIIATPAETHVPLAIHALGRAIPVLVEKPVAPDSASLHRLAVAAAASPAFLLPGHILRFSSPHAQLRDVLLNGEIGELVRFSSRRYRDAGHALRYRDIDPVLMTMIHDIDLALWFAGAPAVSAQASRQPAGTLCSLTSACVTNASGTTWQLSAGWLHPPGECPADRVEIIGTKGSAELHVGSHIDVYAGTHRRIEIDNNNDPLRNELGCFLSGIGSGQLSAPVSMNDAQNGVEAAEMIIGALAR